MIQQIKAELFSSNYIKFRGRNNRDEQGASIYYTGSGFDLKFMGQDIQITMLAEFEEEIKKPFVYIELKSLKRLITFDKSLDLGVNQIDIKDLEEDVYELSFYKRTEEIMSKTKVLLIETSGEFLENEDKKQLSIEFIGDSTACGFGNLSNDPCDSFQTADEDGMKAYPILTAKSLKAYFEIIAVSGIGVYKSIYADYTMPKIYDFLSVDNQKKHIHRKFDWIVVGLGSNDNSYMKFLVEPSILVEQENFKKHYRKFLFSIRKTHPQAKILCLSQKERQEHVHTCIKEVVTEFNDQECYHLNLDAIKKSDGIGAQYHPTVKTHQRWSNTIKKFIEQK